MTVVDEPGCGCDINVAAVARVDGCPLCGNEGISVSKQTVKHLVTGQNQDAVKGDQYRICMNEDCRVVYTA